jgi:hypothetical protein
VVWYGVKEQAHLLRTPLGWLGGRLGPVSAMAIEQIARPGDQAADVEHGSLMPLALHGVIAFLDPPASSVCDYRQSAGFLLI